MSGIFRPLQANTYKQCRSSAGPSFATLVLRWASIGLFVRSVRSSLLWTAMSATRLAVKSVGMRSSLDQVSRQNRIRPDYDSHIYINLSSKRAQIPGGKFRAPYGAPSHHLFPLTTHIVSSWGQVDKVKIITKNKLRISLNENIPVLQLNLIVYEFTGLIERSR